MHKDYLTFLASKRANVALVGFDVDDADISPKLFKFQRAIVKWALRLGKAAIFAECGLGKTAMQLEWSKHVSARTGKPVLILAPLAVAHQTVHEGEKFEVSVVYVKDGQEVAQGYTSGVITNYQRLKDIDVSIFAGIVLDESSILKNYMGKTKQMIIDLFAQTPYKLCCTATPAPNDHIELGNHSEFLNVMPSSEMLMRWFFNDTMKAGGYRLKNHARDDYWRWVTSWAVCISQPKDLGDEYDMPSFVLPPLRMHEHRLASTQATINRAQADGRLMPDDKPTATSLHKVKRESLHERVAKAKEIVDAMPEDEFVLLWCDTNDEADALMKAFPEALEVRGDQKDSVKEAKIELFATEQRRMLISKPEILGYGLNFQHCSQMVFVGVGFSFEKVYQALRRSWRFGQKREVNAHIIYTESEGNVMSTLVRKRQEFEVMQLAMNKAMREYGLFRDGNGNNLVSSIGAVPISIPVWFCNQMETV